jgi:hypothetical protein
MFNRQIKISLIIAAVIAVSSLQAQQIKGTVYYFYADNCAACKQAQAFYHKPEGLKDGDSWAYNGIKFTAYKIADSRNQVITKNINTLNSLCSAIGKRKGDNSFVYFRRDVYEYYKNKGLPYFRKEEKYSRKDEAFLTPVFVIGDRVVLGFNQELVQQALKAAK